MQDYKGIAFKIGDLLTDTGHSIHDERPVFLAREIDAFLRAHG